MQAFGVVPADPSDDGTSDLVGVSPGPRPSRCRNCRRQSRPTRSRQPRSGARHSEWTRIDRVQPVVATLLIREVCCGTPNRLDDGVDGSVTDEVAGTAADSARTSGVQASELCFPSAGSIMPGFRAATKTGSARSGPCRERRSSTTAGSSTRTMAGTGRHSSTADAAAARTGPTVAVVNLHATTCQAEVSRSPRPRLWR